MPERDRVQDVDPFIPAGLERWERSRVVNRLPGSTPSELAGLDLAAISAGLVNQYLHEGDLRRLNLALKVDDIRRATSASIAIVPDADWIVRGLGAAYAEITANLPDLTPGSQAVDIDVAGFGPAGPPGSAATKWPQEIALLYSAGSGTATQVVASGAKLANAAQYNGPAVGAGPYASAWQPAGSVAPPVPPPSRQAELRLKDWGEVGSWLADLPADLPVIIVGMPVVPGGVLSLASATLVNAHNGPLPAVRGLDALGWCLATGQSPTATAHEVAPEVDTGQVLAAVEIPALPLRTLRHRMRTAQVQALRTAVAEQSNPPPSEAPPRYYGRMHPRLRNVLDNALWERSNQRE